MPPKRADDADRQRALQNESGELRRYVVSRLKSVEAANIAGSHLLGIATQSIRSLEVLMRNCWDTTWTRVTSNTTGTFDRG